MAVRLIVEREREIEKFKPEEYWSLDALLKKTSGEELDLMRASSGEKEIFNLLLGIFALNINYLYVWCYLVCSGN